MNRATYTFSQPISDDPASRAMTVTDIVQFLSNQRVIITLDEIKARFPGRFIPIDTLSLDERVEISLEKDRFIYVPMITRKYHKYLSNLQDLSNFLREHPNGIILGELFDAYQNVEADLEQLHKDDQIVIINPSEKVKRKLADGTEMDDFVNTASAQQTTAAKPTASNQTIFLDDGQGGITTANALKIQGANDKRVVYFADSWLQDYKHLDQKYIDLWKDYPLPHETTSITNYLKEHGHDVLPPKATR